MSRYSDLIDGLARQMDRIPKPTMRPGVLNELRACRVCGAAYPLRTEPLHRAWHRRRGEQWPGSDPE